MQKKSSTYKIPKAFTIALSFAVLFWLLIKLSKEYKTVVSFPVEYKNIPQDKLIQKEPLKNLDIQIKASGFKLIGLQIFNKKIALDATKLQRKSSTDYYFLLQNQLLEIQEQISKNYVLEYFVQDSVFLNLGTLTTKKIALKGEFDISYKLGYHLMKEISISPDSILVSGPKEQIDTLSYMYLEKLTLNNVSKSIASTLTIKDVANTINFSVKKALVFGEIDRFTEGIVEIPFEIINAPDSIAINTFPTSLKIVFQSGLTNFNKVNSSSFKVICDYNQSFNNNLNYLIPKVIMKPDFVTSVKLVPNKVEFLIQR